jgi:hypothetical protein
MDNVRKLRSPAVKLTSPGRRFRANWPAQLRVDAARIPCQIIDISVRGAKLDADWLPMGIGRVWLVVDFLEPIAAELAWRRRGLLGLRFLKDHPDISWLQNRRFDPAAWLGADNRTAAAEEAEPA